MEIKQLKTFIAVVKNGGFSRAAEKTGFVQSSISSQIRMLEEELGTRLFERLGRKTHLTAEGETLLAYAEKIAGLESEAREMLSNAQKPGGTLRIGASETLCISHLPPMLREYRTRYPGVELILRIGSAAELCSWVAENEVDIAFLIDRPVVSDILSAEILRDEPILLLASPKDGINEKSPVHPKDLERRDLILTDSGSYRSVFDEMLADESVRPASVMESASIEAIKKLVVSGLGITLLPRAVVLEELRTGQLIDLQWSGPDFRIKSQIVRHKHKWLSPALRAMIDMARSDISESH